MKSSAILAVALTMALYTVKAIEPPSFNGTEPQKPLIEECPCEYSWQHAYAEYINGMEYYSGLYIGDINKDGIPEAVIDINTLGSTIVLYDTKDGIQELALETVSAWGSVTYIPDTGQFLHSPFYGHTTGTWGYEEYYLYDWTGETYVQTFSMLRESGYYLDEDNYEYGVSYIDGEEVGNDAFEARLKEVEALKEKNSKSLLFWHLGDEGFENKVKDILPCFKMPDYEEWH